MVYHWWPQYRKKESKTHLSLTTLSCALLFTSSFCSVSKVMKGKSVLCLWTLSYKITQPISLIFSLRMFSCFINSSLFSIFFGPSLDHINKTNQVICILFFLFFFPNLGT